MEPAAKLNEPVLNVSVVVGEARVGVVERSQLFAQEKSPVRTQVRGQGVTPGSQMATDMVRERSEDENE